VLHDERIDLGPGDRLVLFTDGVTEGRHGDELFGEDRLTVAVQRHGPSADGLVNGILADVERFQTGALRDDIAIVALHVLGDGRPVREPENGR
jgi:sigma-B regulation protein RsbU (phosphoserine phosphatase)